MPEHLPAVRANQQVQLELRTGFRDNALLAPAQAIVADGGQPHLLVLSDNRVRWIPVETGIEQRDVVEIRSDAVTAGAQVVLPAAAPPANGQAVQLKPSAS